VINRAIIQGRLTNEPEQRTTPGGQQVTSFVIANNRGMRKLASGEEVERTTFLGVDVTLVQPALGAQLGLPWGTGLVVERLSPRSPAAGVLKEHDVLTHLDDQILIDVRQLMVLVRNRKEGDEVALTYLRGGAKSTAKVKLIAQDMPKYPYGGMPVPMPPRAFPRGGPGAPRSQPAPSEPEGGVLPDSPRPDAPVQPVQPKSI